MTYDPNIHHRRSIRLKGYDYTQPGAYFITMVSFRRDKIFGEVSYGEMQLSGLGEIVNEEWLRSGTIRQEIQLFDDEFVVMPNHVHGIVRIIEVAGANDVRLARERAHAMRPDKPNTLTRDSLRRAPRSLGSFVAGFKAAVSSRAARELRITGIWQRNYHEHIIRNETEFNNIWHYIDTNPLHWHDDQLHPALPPKQR